jgi:hypothetical protein
MFKLNVDDRLSSWASLRAQLETCEDPLQCVIDFWCDAPFVPYNRRIDPFNQTSWPTPWEIIVENQYDDFTKALMMAYSLKFTQRYKDTNIQVRSLLDKTKSSYYNIVCVDALWVINYNDNSAILLKNIPDSFFIENLIEVNPVR